ncbi:ubiquinone/menaquinone biosynthesis methyltransferase [Variovorax boronicumulans]|uniref:ubiquinone/menaquinone biosynthesis methyltransferase n=1 Tax=Variovorax boronicumulans TaxID=436515 RepID=UPI002781393B|nr:ubiquinone/menaquinone biosynthesis methyltransferase [Variovorax boronicumulans]MDQ0073036.1 ubiquinone/menaquinone biosynthesis methyltransferase [Variovorax boronicumulans]
MNNAADFRTQEDDVFGRIAGRYDLLSDLFSLGIHRLWKRRVAALITQEPWTDLLDVAAGTGDVVLKVAQRKGLRSGQKIVATDISPQMLSIARRRAAQLQVRVEFRVLDAHAMPDIADNSVDLYSISLGLKICERKLALREALRVLKPGGRFIALEASNISVRWLHRAYLGYMAVCMPVIGWAATGGDASAYRYLLKGIQDFPRPKSSPPNSGRWDSQTSRSSGCRSASWRSTLRASPSNCAPDCYLQYRQAILFAFAKRAAEPRRYSRRARFFRLESPGHHPAPDPAPTLRRFGRTRTQTPEAPHVAGQESNRRTQGRDRRACRQQGRGRHQHAGRARSISLGVQDAGRSEREAAARRLRLRPRRLAARCNRRRRPRQPLQAIHLGALLAGRRCEA